MKKCPRGKTPSYKTKRCIKKCRPGEIRSKKTNRCQRRAQKSKRSKNIKRTKSKTARGRPRNVYKTRTRSVLKRTKSGALRLSARAYWNGGGHVGDVHCYGGKCKHLKLRRLASGKKSPYWG